MLNSLCASLELTAHCVLLELANQICTNYIKLCSQKAIRPRRRCNICVLLQFFSIFFFDYRIHYCCFYTLRELVKELHLSFYFVPKLDPVRGYGSHRLLMLLGHESKNMGFNIISNILRLFKKSEKQDLMRLLFCNKGHLISHTRL